MLQNTLFLLHNSMSLKATKSTQIPLKNKQYLNNKFWFKIKAHKNQTFMFKEDEKSHARDTVFGPSLEAQSQQNFIVAAEKEIHCTCEIC